MMAFFDFIKFDEKLESKECDVCKNRSVVMSPGVNNITIVWLFFIGFIFLLSIVTVFSEENSNRSFYLSLALLTSSCWLIYVTIKKYNEQQKVI